MRRKIVFGSVLLLIVAAVAYILLRPTQVYVTEAKIGPAAQFVYASGQVTPEEKITVRSKIVARINRLLVSEGQSVAKGEVLVLLDSQESAALLTAARSELSQTRTDYEYKSRELGRIQRLFEQQAVSRRDYDIALTALRSAENAMRRASANVEAFDARSADFSLNSPFDGVVLEKLLDVGALVTNTDAILTLSDKAAMIIEGKVDELDAEKVKVGQKVLISFDSLKEKVFEGTVRTLAPRIDYATKSFKIKISVPTDAPMRAGMSAELNILVLEKPRALLIPANALTGSAVWIAEDGRARLKTVKVGLRDSRRIEITEGLGEGALVIENPSGLAENQRIRTTERAK